MQNCLPDVSFSSSLFSHLLLCLLCCAAAFSPPMKNHVSSPINTGSLHYKSDLPVASPRSYSPLSAHFLREEDVNRLDGFSFVFNYLLLTI